MTITARYPSRCATCGQAITVGSQIEWSKGQPTRHATCSQQAVTTTPAAASQTYRAPTAWVISGMGTPKADGKCSMCRCRVRAGRFHECEQD
jgi:ferredoxin